MSEQKAIRNLRSVLVELFHDPERARMVTKDAEIDTSRINFHATPELFWDAIIKVLLS